MSDGPAREPVEREGFYRRVVGELHWKEPDQPPVPVGGNLGLFFR